MNSKLRLIALICFCVITVSELVAQHQHRGDCGVTYEMEQQLPVYTQKDVDLYYEAHPERNAAINIPVMFHLVANSQGEGRIKRRFVMNSLCRMNRDYAPHGIAFYLKDEGFNEINNNNIFLESFNSWELIVNAKNGAAVDIFVTENANTSEPDPNDPVTVLGYYSPSGDFIIIQKEEMQDSSGTMSHEVGHYFSLRHPHSGWNEPYNFDTYGDMVPFTTIPGSGAEVEMVNRSNCETAGDRLCDTPADYLLGLGSGFCGENFGITDPNGDPLESQANLSMGYFSDCPKYVFSPQQVDRVKVNIDSPGRNFLDSNHTPNETEITGELVITSPGVQETVETYNGVEITWEGVENADNYLVEITNFSDVSDFYEYTTSNESIYVTDLEPDKVYAIEVKPYNDAYTCYPEVSLLPFFTGSTATSVEDPSFVSDFVVYPNPSTTNQDVIIDLTSTWSGSASLTMTNLSGQVINTQSLQISNGDQKIIASKGGTIQSGIYFVKLSTAQGNVTRKIVIQ